MNTILRSTFFFVFCAAALATSAKPIQYTVTATGSGMFNGSVFSSALVTLTGVGDTGHVSGFVGFQGFDNEIPLGVTVSVAGLGSDTFIGRYSAFVYQTGRAGGFYNGNTQANVLSVGNAAFATYDLKTDIGPLAGFASYLQTSVVTTRGSFSLNSVDQGTFTAGAPTNPAPEPSALAALGFGALTFVKRRR